MAKGGMSSFCAKNPNNPFCKRISGGKKAAPKKAVKRRSK
jgi:hypothetical protein